MKGLGMLFWLMTIEWFRTAAIDAGIGTYAPLKGTLQATIAMLVPSRRTIRKLLQNVGHLSRSKAKGFRFAFMSVLAGTDGT